MIRKRVAAVNDISCFGRCSLTAALPIISAAGIETAVIPTAVLSTHTGGFKGYTFRDLTDDILPIARHLNSENIKFDTVFTGYLGSIAQAEIVKNAIAILKKDNALVIVDPVMADFGKLYGGFEPDFPEYMKRLITFADVITPNITEACFLTDTEYKPAPYDEKYIEDLLYKLSDLTSASAVITGVRFDEKNLGAVFLENGNFEFISDKYYNVTFHGTGDIFSSVLTSALTIGKSLRQAVSISVKFTSKCIKSTLLTDPDQRYSVNFEPEIPYFIKLLK